MTSDLSNSSSGGPSDDLIEEVPRRSPTDLFAAWASLQLQLDAHRPRPGVTVEPDSGAAGGLTPVCLVTGFLGAGKSTLVANVLADHAAGRRVTAIVNDIGALPFDPTLVEWASDVRIQLSNGCGCCQSSASMAETLSDVVRSTERAWDMIVIEASGAADPVALAQIIEAEPSVTLDRIVAVVPATFAAPELPGSVQLGAARAIIERQIDAAHCIIVSGCDRVDPTVADATVARLAQLAPGRTITRSSLDAPAVDVLLPDSPRGARLLGDVDGIVHRDLNATTVSPCRPVADRDLRRALRAAQPGLVRVKGRLIVDGRACTVQLTPQSLDVNPDATVPTGHPTGVTLVAADDEALQPVLDLIASRPGTSGFQGGDHNF